MSCRRADEEMAGGLAPAQKAALGLAVNEMMMSRRSERYSVADLMAQLAARGLDYAEADVVEVRLSPRNCCCVRALICSHENTSQVQRVMDSGGFAELANVKP